MVLLNSIPIVGMVWMGNMSSANRRRIQVFPVLASPRVSSFRVGVSSILLGSGEQELCGEWMAQW